MLIHTRSSVLITVKIEELGTELLHMVSYLPTGVSQAFMGLDFMQV